MKQWNITKTSHAGGGWLVQEWHHEAGKAVETYYAFRTLDAARNYVADIVKVDKRVRFTKNNDESYTYRHKS